MGQEKGGVNSNIRNQAVEAIADKHGIPASELMKMGSSQHRRAIF